MRPTVICIDDEAHNNEALERLLRKQYQVFTTTVPAEGLDLIREHQPALIISDQRMPQMTGVELLKKSAEISPDSIRMLLTGYTDLESVISAINEGQIYRYLTKPWEPNDLLITIDKALETYNLKQEVKRQNEQLMSLDQLKTDFMILVTHELRTPLTGISSFVDLLKEEIKNDDQKVYLSHIDKNTARLKKLVEDILIITRLKTESAKPPRNLVNVTKIIEDVAKPLEKKSKKLKVAIQGEASQFSINEAFFRDVLQRLLSNCFQFASGNADIAVTIENEDQELVLTLTNSIAESLTIEPQNLMMAFRKNEKIMNHTQGTGLGLSIVHSLVQVLGGNLEISAKGKKFSVRLSFPNPAP